MVARSATLATLAQLPSPTSSTFPAGSTLETIPVVPKPAASQAMAPPPPPAAIPAPVRTHSSSSTTTSSRSHTASRVSSQTTLPSSVTSTAPSSSTSPKLAPAIALPLVPPGSPLRNTSSERMSFASTSPVGVCGSGHGGRNGGSISKPLAKVDELDRLGYIYTLRVASLQHRLKLVASNSPRLILGPAAVIVAAPSPPNASDSTQSTKGSPFGSFRTPDPVDLPLPIRRKKSALSLRLGRKDKDELKLPREFLPEFWSILTHEQGDMGWTQAVRIFLSLIQKKGTGTKTATGANLREIAVLFTTFSTCLPTGVVGSTPAEAHKTHFLTLLYNVLPTCTYFTNSSNEKDRDLLFRLRAEVQSFLHGPGSPVTATSARGGQFSPELSAQGIAARAGLGFMPASPASPASTINPITPTSPMPSHTPPRRANRPASDAGSVRRKPIPRWTGHGEGLDNMVEAVGAIWEIPEDMLERDAEDLDRYALEKMYLDDLKRSLTNLSRQYMGDQSLRARHSELSRDLADLLSSFPDLSIPTSPAAFGQSTQESFFTPPRSSAVFARLSRRAEASSSRRARELVERCRKIWGVEGREMKEREVETLVRQWDAAVGTVTEVSLGKRLADAVGELASSLDPDEEIPRALDELQVCLMDHFSQAINDIFPVTGDVPPPPPPSVLPLFRAAPSLLVTSTSAAETLDNLADDLRGAAVAEYVTAAGDMMGALHSHQVGEHNAASGKDAVVEGFERVAAWIEMEIVNVEKAWPANTPINPAGVIISKQLPLFLAELQVLETAGGAASDVFALYEITSKLLSAWDRLCPGAGSHFDIDAFFEPHVLTWLRVTEATETHQWVARTVGMDQWIPEGEGRHSQSVVDLFEFIRNATQVVRDLPVGEYKRAVYMVDLARTASAALEQYAGTVSSLFMAEMAPDKAGAKEILLPTGKAGAWLAKGKHAYGKLDAKIDQHRGRERAGFMVPQAAYVKLTNMGAAGEFIDDLSYALDADGSARVLREHLSTANSPAPRQIFTVQVLRGQNILTRGSAKPADSFVAVYDLDTGERLFKSRTVLETEDPKWEQRFEVHVGKAKPLEVVVYDRQLVGKHDAVGARTFKLDPAQFMDEPEREVVLPLSPRGVITLRISAEGRERHDVAYHLVASKRILERTASDMQLEIVNRMSEYLRTILCPATLAAVVRPLRDRKRGRVALSDAEIDASLAPALDYLDESLATINATCAPATCEQLSLGLWERLVDVLLAVLIPPLSDRPSHRTPLAPQEIDVVFKWLQALKAFFHASGAGIPVQHLQAGAYRDMLMLGQVLDLPTPSLRERTAAAVRAASARGAQGVMALRNISLRDGMSRAHVDEDNQRVAEILLRVLRMRSLEDDFLTSQLAALTKAKVERSAAAGL